MNSSNTTRAADDVARRLSQRPHSLNVKPQILPGSTTKQRSIVLMHQKQQARPSYHEIARPSNESLPTVGQNHSNGRPTSASITSPGLVHQQLTSSVAPRNTQQSRHSSHAASITPKRKQANSTTPNRSYDVDETQNPDKVYNSSSVSSIVDKKSLIAPLSKKRRIAAKSVCNGNKRVARKSLLLAKRDSNPQREETTKNATPQLMTTKAPAFDSARYTTTTHNHERDDGADKIDKDKDHTNEQKHRIENGDGRSNRRQANGFIDDVDVIVIDDSIDNDNGNDNDDNIAKNAGIQVNQADDKKLSTDDKIDDGVLLHRTCVETEQERADKLKQRQEQQPAKVAAAAARQLFDVPPRIQIQTVTGANGPTALDGSVASLSDFSNSLARVDQRSHLSPKNGNLTKINNKRLQNNAAAETIDGSHRLSNGTRVYALWEENDSWYYGCVVGYSIKARRIYHTIEFDDGDVGRDTPWKCLVVKSPCGLCEACSRMPCRACNGCRSSVPCYKKMCYRIDVNDKALPLPIFPEGWRFAYIEESRDGSSIPMIYPPSSIKPIRSLKALYRHKGLKNSFDIPNLCAYIGITERLFTRSMSAEKTKSSPVIDQSIVVDQKRSSKKSTTCILELKGRCKVGDRVYARYHDENWYWGKIQSITTGVYFTCVVLFDDGDTMEKLQHWEVMTETEYKEKLNKSPPPPPVANNKLVLKSKISEKYDMEYLFKNRCKACHQCRRKDCGKCLCCRDNDNSTTPDRQACYLNVCEKFLTEKYAQRVPSLPGCFFYIAYPTHKRSGVELFDSRLEGLNVICPDLRQEYNTIEEAAQRRAHKDADVAEISREFYERVLGLKYRKRCRHEYIGKKVYSHWLGANGERQGAVGIVKECFVLQYHCGGIEKKMVVKYDFSFLSDSNNGCIEKELTMDEFWGGVALAKEEGIQSFSNIGHRSYALYWNLPIARYQITTNGPHPSLVVLHKGFALTFVVKESLIPNAGLGVFVSCSSYCNNSSDDAYCLNSGEVLDLGIYAPLCPENLKRQSIFVLKCFIFENEPESWGFDVSNDAGGDHIFDITDDDTGNLHELAKQSILPYVNESDGTELPTVHALHDPRGSVHYMLGHVGEDSCNFMLLPDEEPMELKIDYLSTYEKVRIRKGYSRLCEEKRLYMEETMYEDYDNIKDILLWSCNEVAFSIEFVEHMDFRLNCIPYESQRMRCLLVCIQIMRRLRNIQHDFRDYTRTGNTNPICDNGFTTHNVGALISRTKKVALELSAIWETPEMLTQALKSLEIARFVIVTSLLMSDDRETLDELSSDELLCQLKNM